MPDVNDSIDVFVPTYNSDAHLQQCIDSIKKVFPVKRIVIIDHHSTDSTQEIALKNDCDIVLEDKGLAFARGLSFRLAETELFALVESDLIYDEFGWYGKAKERLTSNVAAVVAYVPRGSHDTRGKYNEVWSRFTPLTAKKHGFSAGSTLLRKDAVQDIMIPERLQAYEDIYILGQLRRRGLTYKWIEVKGMHYSDLGSFEKARWYGANARILYMFEPENLTIIRRHIILPFKGAIASLLSRDPRIFAWSLRFALSFFRGWANPDRFSVFRR